MLTSALLSRSFAACALALTCFVHMPVTARAQATPRPQGVAAQNRVKAARPTDTLVVGMRDGSTFVGQVSAIRGDTVEMSTTVGAIRLSLSDIRRATMVRAKDIVNGEFWFPNPNTTRLLFAPTGRMLKKGDGYFSDYMVFFPGVAGGVTDRFTIGGGFSIFPGTSLDDQLFYVTPKVGLITREKVNVALGVLAARFGLDDDGGENTFAVPYLVGTYGGENSGVTGGIGYGYADGKLAKSPALLFGGDIRLSRRFGLVSENYFFPDAFDGALISLGARFFGEKLSADFGLVRGFGDGDSFTFPYIGLVVNF